MEFASSSPYPKSPASLFQQVAESDRYYFTLGASLSTVAGLNLWHMKGFETSPSAAVVWNISEEGVSSTLEEAQLALLDEELRGLGRNTSRIYLVDPPNQDQVELLRSNGYFQRHEVLIGASVDSILQCTPCPQEARLQLVCSDRDWAEKEGLYLGSNSQPDGYATLPAAWNNLEREKTRSGEMESYLIRYGEEVVGSVSFLIRGRLGRLKNLFVRPSARKRGVGVTTVALLASKARERGCCDLGCFALAGGAGERVYRKAGMHPLGSVSEFNKSL